ncbi:hypothetical protein L1049_023127 [Liquidambar formosana]|uniref:Uncharacterized protein n=1 Tax=Liquidambar formosana TaxID=63359 RepID=A0AAP0RDI2_LIQFO
MRTPSPGSKRFRHRNHVEPLGISDIAIDQLVNLGGVVEKSVNSFCQLPSLQIESELGLDIESATELGRNVLAASEMAITPTQNGTASAVFGGLPKDGIDPPLRPALKDVLEALLKSG